MKKEIINLDMTKKIIEKYNEVAEKEHLLPVKVSAFYDKKVRQEINAIGIGGPLYRSVYPTKERLSLLLENDPRDFVEEYRHMPIEGVNYIIRKYKNRLLFIVTELCFGHCQYCFRAYNIAKFGESELQNNLNERIDILVKYLDKSPEISEVVLSGGDPLMLNIENLSNIFAKISKWDVRIHTRAIIYEPAVINRALAKLLRDSNVRLVLHINHPYEICEVVEKKIKLLHNNGVKLYAQFPLLRGINDNSEIIIRLLTKLDSLGVRPLTIFIADPIKYGASFRLSYGRIKRIINEINWETASWVNAVRFVMDTAVGKVRWDDIVKNEGNKIFFTREDKKIEYSDFPSELDVATDIRKLLWKEF
jgi:lysine 2,3-aminomutase